MLKEIRQALRVWTHAYDMELGSLAEAGADDLKLAGINLPGTVSIVPTEYEDESVTVEDQSTLTDPLCVRAIVTYVRAHFGSPADYDRLIVSYNEQKAQLQTATGYGLPEDEVSE